MTTPLDVDALERVVPDALAEDPATLRAHIERYEFAGSHVSGRGVIDVACGVGYGAEILLRRGATMVLGIDVAQDAIAYARTRYAEGPVRFEVADAMTFDVEEPYEAIVSLETLEHVPDAVDLMLRFARLLGLGGVIVASAPISPSVDVNPYHVHDISEVELRRIFAIAHVEVIDEFKQRTGVRLMDLLRGRIGRRPLRRGLLSLYRRRPDLLVRRVRHTLRHGLSSHYLTLAGTVT